MVAVGQNIGNYKVNRVIGRGGCGEVFEATYEKINRRAAIKVLHPEISQDAEMAQRFLNEARATNIVQHPGIVSIYEHGQLEDGSSYIVMEYLEGQLLARRLDSLSIDGALRIARQIAATLAAAHAKKIIHRDLKPENVMLIPDPEAPGGERVKLLDFGIAKVAQEYEGPGSVKLRTRTGTTMGTPVYMSPEQCRGAKDVTDKTDVYALGVMLYEMLCKDIPFYARSPSEIMAKQIYEAARPLKERSPAVPDTLAALVADMMAKDPLVRPSMNEVSQRLAACEAELGRTLVSYPSFEAVDLRPVRRGWVVATGVGAALLMSVLIALLVHPFDQRAGKIHWTIESIPPDAQVVQERDGKVLGKTPLELDRSRVDGSIDIILRLEGYEDRKLSLDQRASVMVREALIAEPAARKPDEAPADEEAPAATVAAARSKQPAGRPPQKKKQRPGKAP